MASELHLPLTEADLQLLMRRGNVVNKYIVTGALVALTGSGVMISAPIVPSRLVISAVSKPKSPAVPATPELFDEFELFDELELLDEFELFARGMTTSAANF